ncbi:MAG TPA: GGDEF domain-containing protein [Candidatus Binatia bacterium]|nr:GGDEF domain-containing protein [Candidatus Binatia bacterium]
MKRRFLQPRPAPAGDPPAADAPHARAFPPHGRTVTVIRVLLAGLALVLVTLLLRGGHGDGERAALAAAAVLTAIVAVLAQRHMGRQLAALVQVQHLAQVDALTGALNRRGFEAHLATMWRQAERSGALVGLVLVDVDHFKQINDRLGHAVGDAVLKRTADILRTYASRPLDAVCRYGGDEFVLAWYDAQPEAFDALVRLLPAKLWAGLAALDPRARDVTASGGALLARPAQGTTAAAALAEADRGLYEVKRSLRGTIVVVSADPAPAAQRAAS